VFCEPDHSGCQGLAPKCVISQMSLRELSQTGERSAGTQDQSSEEHLVSASWKQTVGSVAGQQWLPSCLNQWLGVVVGNITTTRSLRKAAWWLVVMAALAIPSMAKRHPVPLDPNTDSAKCIDCHQDKTKGASVHTAIQMGCASCHEVRVVKSRDKKRPDVTRVKLTKATSQAVCLTCHEGMKASAGNSRPHLPVTRNCLSCHDPHVSSVKNQLKKGASGDRNDNLCLACHIQGLNVAPNGSRHAALDMGCDACHVTHKTGVADKRENTYHLTKDVPGLCLDCHDAKDKKLAEAHHNQPFATADCLTCHDAHQSLKPKLAQRFQHAPFESGACDACHSDAKDGKVVLTQADTRALCVTCHDAQAKQIESAKVQHPGAQGDCTACHSPHASAYDRLMKPDPVTACENCHAAQAEMHKTKAVLHKAAYRDGCYTCHDAHGGDLPQLLRAQGNKLCLECHSPKRNPKMEEDEKGNRTGLLTIFDGKVRLPAVYFGALPALDLKAGDVMGHPIGNHPVFATVDRSDPQKQRSMGCQSCHQPHAGAANFMLVTDTRSTMPLCVRCHENLVGLPGQDAIGLTKQAPQAQPKKGKKN